MQPSDPSLLRDKCFIDGRWVGGNRTFDVISPAGGEAVAAVPDLGAGETGQAIEAANAAFGAWSALTAKARSRVLRGWFDLQIENREDLAVIMTTEMDKPLAEARGEIDYAASFIEFYAEEAKRVTGETIPAHKAGSRIVVIKQPVGVVAAITPWNFPAAMITRKAGPALAAGCTVVCKPAGATPLTALALAALGERAGIPPGVINVVTGRRSSEIGGELTANPLVRLVTFTGSTATGKVLMAQAASTVKKVDLELGGNAPFIVFDDADLDAAVRGAMASKHGNAGQTCVCANRILVQDGVYDAFAGKLAAAVAGLRLGNGMDEAVTQGPLIDEEGVAKVEEHVADAVERGARVVIGGRRSGLGGTFYERTVLTGVTAGMKVAGEETFGPVAPLFRFRTDDEAIQMANDTRFGLAAYFHSRDLGRCRRVGEALEYGMVGINEGIISTEVAPFGGVKESGLGREGSSHGIKEFVEMKYMLMGGV